MFPLLTLEIEADTTHFAQLPSSFGVPSWSHLETEKELIAGFEYAITLKVTLNARICYFLRGRNCCRISCAVDFTVASSRTVGRVAHIVAPKPYINTNI